MTAGISLVVELLPAFGKNVAGDQRAEVGIVFALDAIGVVRLPAPRREALRGPEPDARPRAHGDAVGGLAPRRLGRRSLDVVRPRRSRSSPPRCSSSRSASACTARSRRRSASISRRRSSSAATSPRRASRGRSAGSSALPPADSSSSTGRCCSGRSPRAPISPAQPPRSRSSRGCPNEFAGRRGAEANSVANSGERVAFPGHARDRRPPQYRCPACRASVRAALLRDVRSRSRVPAPLSSAPAASPGSTSSARRPRRRSSSRPASAGTRSTSRTSCRGASARRSTSTPETNGGRGGYLFTVLHFPVYDAAVGRLNAGELDAFIGPDYLVTLPTVELRPVSLLFRRCDESEELPRAAPLARLGPTALRGARRPLRLLLPDPRQDRLQARADRRGDRRGRRRGREGARPRHPPVKQEIISYRKIIKPQRPTLRQLERPIERFLPEELELYFDDLVDASERIWDLLDNYKEVVEALEDTNESLISHQQNDILYVLTIFLVVLTPLTFITGFFGMNVHFPGFNGWDALLRLDRRSWSSRSSACSPSSAGRGGCDAGG